MISDEADEVIKELFDSLKNRYQNNDFKRRKTVALFCSKKFISIIKRSNF